MQQIYPTNNLLLNSSDFEKFFTQKSGVFWIYGNSGSGKTTLAAIAQRELIKKCKYAVVLDGDNLRSTLNEGLGFSEADRKENLRRAAHVAKIMADNGAIVLACFVSPLKIFREMAKNIIGEKFYEVYIHADIETLISRDSKGFYKKALEGKMENLSGVNSAFEIPNNDIFTINNSSDSLENNASILIEFILSKTLINS